MLTWHPLNSSFLVATAYDEKTTTLHVRYKNGKEYPYVVPIETFKNFLNSESPGKFYTNYIKGKSFTSKSTNMADKIIKVRIDVKKLVKEWFFKGEKGTYLDVTILYNEDQDQYQTNGMVVQDVPKAVYEKDKSTKGPILGNCKNWATQKAERDAEAQPGAQAGTMGAVDDDLPF